MKHIAIIGYGVVGKATARTIRKSHKVTLYDPSLDLNNPYENADIIFICTPSENVQEYLKKLKDHKNVFVRSTIPFHLVKDTNYAVWPEFLTERTAEHDSINPKCNVVGANIDQYNELLDVTIFNDYTLTTNVYAALMKLSTNIYFIQKVTFANMLYNICSTYGLEYDKLKDVLGADDRMWIHDHFDVPGPDGKLGWGGRCFPKNLDMMKTLVNGSDTHLVDFLQHYNNQQREDQYQDWLTGYKEYMKAKEQDTMNTMVGVDIKE